MRSVRQKLSFLFVLAILVSMLVPGMGAFAAEKELVANQVYGENHDSTANTANENIEPLSTVVGPGGTAKIDYISSARQLVWSVKPSSSWPYEFFGTIDFSYGASGTVALFETGVGWEGGQVNARGSGYCGATLNGTAYALNGSQFKVLPGCFVGYNI